MESLDLTAYGVEEMSQEEMVKTEGGFLWFAAGLCAALIAWMIVDVC